MAKKQGNLPGFGPSDAEIRAWEQQKKQQRSNFLGSKDSLRQLTAQNNSFRATMEMSVASSSSYVDPHGPIDIHAYEKFNKLVRESEQRAWPETYRSADLKATAGQIGGRSGPILSSSIIQSNNPVLPVSSSKLPLWVEKWADKQQLHDEMWEDFLGGAEFLDDDGILRKGKLTALERSEWLEKKKRGAARYWNEETIAYERDTYGPRREPRLTKAAQTRFARMKHNSMMAQALRPGSYQLSLFPGLEPVPGSFEDVVRQIKQEELRKASWANTIASNRPVDPRQISLLDWKPKTPGPQVVTVPKIQASSFSKLSGWKVGGGIALGVGLGLTGINALRFSGHKDEYNTISGMSEKGLAAKLRKENTDFGSGYQGPNEGFGIGDALSFFNAAALIGAAGLTGYDRFGVKGVVGGALAGAGIVGLSSALKYENPVSFSEKAWNGIIEGLRASAGGSMIASSFMRGGSARNLLGRVGGGVHGAILDDMTADLGQIIGMSKEHSSAAGIYGVYGRGARYLLEKKLPGRLGRYAGIGIESQFSSPAVLDLVVKHGTIRNIPAADYIKSNISDVALGTLGGAAFSLPVSGLVHLFSGKDDAYNTIEGMSEKGFASRLRKKNTDFGSGYQGLSESETESYKSALWNLKFAGFGLAVPAYIAARKESPGSVMGRWYGSRIGPTVKYLPAVTFAGVEGLRLASGEASPWEIGAGVVGSTLAGSAMKAIAPFAGKRLSHMGLASGAVQLAAFAGYMGAQQGYNLFSGRGENYNTIPGRQNRDRDESNPVTTALFAGAGLGAGSYFGMKYALSPSGFSPQELAKYPQLQKLREAGQKHGYEMVATSMGVDEIKKFRGYKGVLYNYNIYPTDKVFDELVKSHDWKWPAQTINVGAWNIGTEKLSTIEYFKKKGLGSMHAETWDVFQFANMGPEGGYYDHWDKIHAGQAKAGDLFKLNPHLAKFVEAEGGPSQFVVKHNLSALQEGVWMGLDKVPESRMLEMFDSPEAFHIQRKLPLKAEFRAITVGGKSIFEAHRFGSDWLKAALEKGEKVSPSLVKQIKESHYHENIVPVADKGVRKGLIGFVEKAHAALPEQVGITAWDIGLTTSGEYKIIEAQRMFGTIRNPVVQERIEYALTGKFSSKWSRILRRAPVGIGLAGAAVALMGSSLFSGKDDDHNTIEGLHPGAGPKSMARPMIQRDTDFGSGSKMVAGRSVAEKVISLFRGTATKIETHIGGYWYRHSLEEATRFKSAGVERFLERIRRKEFTDRPSRFVSSFWAPDVETAATYATMRGTIATGGTISQITRNVDDVFVASHADYLKLTDMLIKRQQFRELRALGRSRSLTAGEHSRLAYKRKHVPSRGEIEETARRYWRGVDIKKETNLRELEVLIPGQASTERYFSVRKSGFSEFEYGVPAGNSATNVLPGALHPQGELSGPTNEAKKIINALTPFGSQYDTSKALMQLLRQTYDETGALKVFHEALAGGRVVKQLGAGAFGKADLMETTIAGQHFQYVKKTARSHEELEQWAQRQTKEYMRMYPEALPEQQKKILDRAMMTAKRNADLENEGQMLRSVEQVLDITPTAYKSGKNELFMEFMEGQTLRQLLREGQDVTAPAMLMQEQFRKLASAGIINPDPNIANVLWNPQTKRLSWIDWGYAEQGMDARIKYGKRILGRMQDTLEISIEKEKQLIMNKMGGVKSPLASSAITPEAPSLAVPMQQVVPQLPSSGQIENIKRLQRADLNRSAQQDLWANGQRPGQRHDQSYIRRQQKARNPYYKG